MFEPDRINWGFDQPSSEPTPIDSFAHSLLWQFIANSLRKTWLLFSERSTQRTSSPFLFSEFLSKKLPVGNFIHSLFASLLLPHTGPSAAPDKLTCHTIRAATTDRAVLKVITGLQNRHASTAFVIFCSPLSNDGGFRILPPDQLWQAV